MEKIKESYAAFLRQRQDNSTLRVLTPYTPQAGGKISDGKNSYINVSSNDYLGLSQHPALITRAQEWTNQYGAGSGASRLVTGNIDVFTALEDKLAAFKSSESALIMGSGFQTNASVLPALFDSKILGQAPLVFSDKLNHASIHLGCSAAGVKQIRFRHNDMNHLESLLKKYADSSAPKFIITETVFSMDGDIAPMAALCTFRDQYEACLIVDDAHAAGVLGTGGKGLSTGADITIGTFSKAMGCFGAYVACSKTIKDFLVNRCGGVIYSTALPPSILGSIDAALDLIPTMDSERAHLQTLAQEFRETLNNAGCETGDSQTQIIPLIIGDSEKTIQIAAKLKSSGFLATAIRTPTVPKGSARIRFALSSVHEMKDIERLAQTLIPLV